MKNTLRINLGVPKIIELLHIIRAMVTRTYITIDLQKNEIEKIIDFYNESKKK